MNKCQGSGTAIITRHISRWQLAGNLNYGNDQNKSLSTNYIQKIIKIELLMWRQAKEKSRLRLVLLDSGGPLYFHTLSSLYLFMSKYN